MFVITLSSGRITFVESSRPPMPTSTTATSTSRRAKWSNAIAVVISKNDGCTRPIVSRFRSTYSTTSRSEIVSPSTRMRSRKSFRWGDVNRPVRYPAADSAEAIRCDTEPLPLVPATCTLRKRRCGTPEASSSATMRSSPAL